MVKQSVPGAQARGDKKERRYSRIHVDVVAAEVERDEELEQERVGCVGRREEAQQTRGCTPVPDARS